MNLGAGFEGGSGRASSLRRRGKGGGRRKRTTRPLRGDAKDSSVLLRTLTPVERVEGFEGRGRREKTQEDGKNRVRGEEDREGEPGEDGETGSPRAGLKSFAQLGSAARFSARRPGKHTDTESVRSLHFMGFDKSETPGIDRLPSERIAKH